MIFEDLVMLLLDVLIVGGVLSVPKVTKLNMELSTLLM